MSENTEFKGWARVEVMGHQTHIGYVTTEAYGGAVLFRIDQPGIPEVEEALKRPDYVDGKYCPIGTVVKMAAIEAVSVLVGSGSIYRIIPCDEAAAMSAARSAQRRPLMVVKLADESKMLAAAIASEQDPDDDENDYERDLEEREMPGGFQ